MRLAEGFERAVVAIAALTIAVGLGLLLTFSYGRDQGIYAIVARTVLDGGMPYRDAFDFKPPGIFLVYAAARGLFGSAQFGVRAVEVAGLAAMTFGMMHLTRLEWGDPRIGLTAAALAILVHAQLDFWHTGQPESFGGMLTIGGLLIARRAHLASSPRSRWTCWFLVGAIFGVAGAMKPPLAGQAAVLGLLSAIVLRKIAPLAATALGGIASLGAFVAWFAIGGALEEAHEVLFVYTPHYTALGWEGYRAIDLIEFGVKQWLFGYSFALPAGLALLLVVWPRPHERRGIVVLASLVAVQLAGVILQAKFFPYHYGSIWPLTALAASLGFWRLFGVLRERAAPVMGLVIAAVVALSVLKSATSQNGGFVYRSQLRFSMWWRGVDPATQDWLATVADVDAGHNRRVAALVAERTPAGSSIFVWGFEPVVYDLAERPAATRYIYNVPQRTAWSRDEAQAILLRDLAANPPSAIVVERGDVFPWVTGDDDDSARALESFDGLRDLVRREYRLLAIVDDFDVYVR